MSVVLLFPSRRPGETTAAASPVGARWVDGHAAGLLATFVLPVALALAAVGLLLPSRMDGGSGGALAWLARIGVEQPAVLGGSLILALSVCGRYWLTRARTCFGGAVESSRRLRSYDRRVGVWLAIAAIALSAALVRATLVDLQRVVGISMAPTLKPGDRLLVNRLAYGLHVPFTRRRFGARTPGRGDIVVFPSAESDRGSGPRALVKRVIGLPGDVISFREGSPVINGWAVPSCDAGPFLTAARGALVRGRVAVEVLAGRAYLTVRTVGDDATFSSFEVPPGELFVLGDDRVASDDSRAWNGGRGGGVPIDSVVGRVSRLALGAPTDRRLDLHRVLMPLRPALREAGIDVSAIDRRIAVCLAHQPRSSEPPNAPKEAH